MNLLIVIFLAAVAVAAVVAIETWRMHRRDQSQSPTHVYRKPPMNEPVEPFSVAEPITRTVARRDARPRGLDPDGSMSFPEGETSLNDVARFREQDQAIAQLSEQLNRMVGTPWEIVDAKSSDLYTAEINCSGADVRKVAWQLSQMCNPVAVVGSQPANVGVGTTLWAEVGNRRIAADNRGHQAELLARLNGGYASIVAKHRDRTLAQLHQYAAARDPSASIPLAKAPVAVKCGQTYVACESRTEAQALVDELTASYQSAVKDAAARVLVLLLHATAPKVGRDLRAN